MLNKASGYFHYQIALSIVTLSAAALLLFFYISHPGSSTYPVLGENLITDIGVIEDHKFALSRWIDRGIKGGILINIDGHDDFKKISDSKIKSLQSTIKQFYPSEKNPLPAHLVSSVSEGNFIYAAAKLGVVDEVYWVTPTSFFNSINREDQFQAMMAFHQFQPDEIKGLSFKDGMYSGLLFDIPFHICEISSLPTIKEPVLLSIDSDYAPVLATNFDEKLIDTNTRIFQALSTKRYKIRDAVVAYSVNGGHIPSYQKWIGDMAVDYLKEPDLLRQKLLPDKYITLQQAERLLMMKRYDELMTFLFPILEKNIYNPAILIYMAYALDGLGLESKAMNCAEKACLSDTNYCYGLCELGCKVMEKKGLKSAEEYFTRAYKGNPTMAHSQFKYARALQKEGRYDDALKYFNDFRAYYGPFPADFYIGQTYMLKGNIDTALKYYNTGRRELAENPNLWASFGDRNLVKDIILFYEMNGHDNQADELRIALKTGERYLPAGMVMD